MKLNIPIVLGSVRENRQGIKAAKFIIKELESRGHKVTFIDPLEEKYELPLLKKMYKSYEKEKAPKKLQNIHEIFQNADAIVLVSPEYNHSIPPALSNILDHFLEEYKYKPSGLVTYSSGTVGGARVAVQLREMVAEMGMPSISSVLTIPKIQEVLDENGKTSEEKLISKTKKFLDEFEWYAEALKNQREK